MAGLAVYPKFRSLKPDGSPNSGGKVFTKVTGASTDKISYTDASELTPLANPVILDSNGEAEIWLKTDGAYRLVIGNSSCAGITDTANIYLDINNIVGIPDLTTATISLGGTLTLTGNLNTNGYDIISVNNSNINITPGGSGETRIKNPLLVSGNLDTNGNNIKFSATTGFIDTSLNPLLQFSPISSAVNGITLANAATGNKPTISATGSDTNISLSFQPKGTGFVQLGGANFPNNTGTSGQILTMGADGTVQWANAAAAFATNYISGFKLTKAATQTLRIGVGQCADSANNAVLSLLSSLDKAINSNWTVGTGGGGKPSSVTLAADTAYHVFAIRHSAGTVDCGIDTSITASNLLTTSGYSQYRRVGTIYTNTGDTNIRGFVHIDDHFLFEDPSLDYNAAMNTSGANVTLRTPPGVVCVAILNVACDNLVYLSNTSQTNSAPSTTAAPLANANTGSSGLQYIPTDTSKQIRHRGANTASLRLATWGWIDFRGRN